MRPATTSIVVTALLASTALADEGDLLWRHDVRGASDWDAAEAVAVDGDQAFAIGGVADSETGVMPILVRAYDLTSGEVLWSRELASDGWAGGTHIAVTADVVFVIGAGQIAHPDGRLDWDWIYAAYDRRRGKELWSRRVDSGGNDYVDIAVVARGRLVLGGSLSDQAVVTAVDPATGDEDGWRARAPFRDGHSYTDNLVVVGDLVVATGIELDAWWDYSTSDVWCAAFDLETGDPLWDRRLESPGAEFGNGALAAAGGRVFVAQNAERAEGDRQLVIRALDLETGADDWRYTTSRGGNGYGGASLVVAGGVLAVAGGALSGVFPTPNFAGHDTFVAAHDLETGRQLWITEPVDHVYAGATAVATDGESIFVLSRVWEVLEGLRVQAFEVDGTERWRSEISRAMATATFNSYDTLAVGGGTVVVAGVTFGGDFPWPTDWLVAAFSDSAALPAPARRGR
jgi:outer membrane protein assembly factor BamB